jgi:hypothetical protein
MGGRATCVGDEKGGGGRRSRYVMLCYFILGMTLIEMLCRPSDVSTSTTTIKSSFQLPTALPWSVPHLRSGFPGYWCHCRCTKTPAISVKEP